MIELKDTVDMMTSDDYKERFKAEYYQLKDRYTKLTKMVDAWDKGELNFKPTCPRTIYTLQMDAMQKYLAVLDCRAAIEGIELDTSEVK